jgi:GDP-D-mannose dehydratase
MERGTSKKKALITGLTGQDGAYLAKFLMGKGYQVYGTYRRLSTPNFWQLQYLDIFDSVKLIPADLVDTASIVEPFEISEPDDYVIATNETHSVAEFALKAFDVVNLDWQRYVKVDKRFFRPLDVPVLQGDPSKAEQNLGWRPNVRFDKLVIIMVGEDLNRWKRWQKGESFLWDALNYPHEANIITRALRV